jgi:hypothetical protein
LGVVVGGGITQRRGGNNSGVDRAAHFIWIELRFHLDETDDRSNGILQGFWDVGQYGRNRVNACEPHALANAALGFSTLLCPQNKLILSEV